MRPSLLALRRACLPAVLALVAAFTFAPAAAAHNPPPVPTPADGATVAAVPDEIVLTFTDVVLDVGAAVAVTSPDGAELADGPPVVDGAVVTQQLTPERPAGEYTVAWRVTSADGHPVDGTFAFTASDAVGVPSPSPTATATTAAPTTAAPVAAPTPSAPGTETPAPTPGAGPGRTIALVVGIAGLLVFIPLLVRRLRETGRD